MNLLVPGPASVTQPFSREPCSPGPLPLVSVWVWQETGAWEGGRGISPSLLWALSGLGGPCCRFLLHLPRPVVSPPGWWPLQRL